MAAVGRIGIFASNAISYTWAADGNTTLSDTIILGMITYPRRATVEVGLWSLFIKATAASALTITPKLYYLIDQDNTLYSDVAHSISGYSTDSPSTLVTTFDANGGECFEANLSAWQAWWVYGDGFKIDILRSSSNVAVTFNFGGIRTI